jgi:hypothetical protein
MASFTSGNVFRVEESEETPVDSVESEEDQEDDTINANIFTKLSYYHSKTLRTIMKKDFNWQILKDVSEQVANNNECKSLVKFTFHLVNIHIGGFIVEDKNGLKHNIMLPKDKQDETGFKTFLWNEFVSYDISDVFKRIDEAWVDFSQKKAVIKSFAGLKKRYAAEQFLKCYTSNSLFGGGEKNVQKLLAATLNTNIVNCLEHLVKLEQSLNNGEKIDTNNILSLYNDGKPVIVNVGYSGHSFYLCLDPKEKKMAVSNLGAYTSLYHKRSTKKIFDKKLRYISLTTYRLVIVKIRGTDHIESVLKEGLNLRNYSKKEDKAELDEKMEQFYKLVGVDESDDKQSYNYHLQQLVGNCTIFNLLCGIRWLFKQSDSDYEKLQMRCLLTADRLLEKADL